MQTINYPDNAQENYEVEVQLSPYAEYKFRVKAVNKIGPSPPGELQEPVLAKDPWGPAGPPLDLQVEDWDATYVDLTWKPPVSNGGADGVRGMLLMQYRNTYWYAKSYFSPYFKKYWGYHSTPSTPSSMDPG